MDRPGSRATIFGRVAIAHVLGLWATGMMGTIQSTAGFSIGEGAFIGIFLGGLLSLPWIIGLAGFIWFYGGLIERHPFAFAVIGPLVVCGTWAVTFGGMLEAVAISTVVSSFCYFLLTFFGRWRRAALANEA